jgi:uncharacterized membrane protein YeaQ/YmgE (transglycosylase-associated protein family)
MSILAWVILGLLAGFISSKLMSGSGEGVVLDTVLGVVGAVVGGLMFNLLGAAGVTGFNVWSLIVATVGAMVLIALKRAFMGRGSRLASR